MRGAAWMVERECATEGPSGGILADAMVSASSPILSKDKKGSNFKKLGSWKDCANHYGMDTETSFNMLS
jgi:hypothetical protein